MNIAAIRSRGRTIASTIEALDGLLADAQAAEVQGDLVFSAIDQARLLIALERVRVRLERLLDQVANDFCPVRLPEADG